MRVFKSAHTIGRFVFDFIRIQVLGFLAPGARLFRWLFAPFKEGRFCGWGMRFAGNRRRRLGGRF